MGDRTHVWFRFSGRIRRANLPELLDAIESEGGVPGNDATPENQQWSDDNFADTITIEECDYAHPISMTHVAKSLGLSYICWWCAGGGYGAGYQGYFAVTDTTVECMAAYDLEPVLALSQLGKFKTIEEAQSWLNLFENRGEAWPPLEIIDDERKD